MQIISINQSIERGWQSVFEVKEQDLKYYKQQPKKKKTKAPKAQKTGNDNALPEKIASKPKKLFEFLKSSYPGVKIILNKVKSISLTFSNSFICTNFFRNHTCHMCHFNRMQKYILSIRSPKLQLTK